MAKNQSCCGRFFDCEKCDLYYCHERGFFLMFKREARKQVAITIIKQKYFFLGIKPL